MKRYCAIMLLLMLLIHGEALSSSDENVDISQYTVEQLLSLKETIDIRLLDLGVYPFITLMRNDKGEEVERLQRRLKELDYLSYEATGKYDNNAQFAQKSFEKANNLKEDGVASPEDQRVLFSRAAIPKNIPAPTPNQLITETPDPVRSQYLTLDYEEYARFPEKYVQQKVYLKGKVEQVLGSRQDGYQIRLSVLNNTSNIIYIYINEDPGYNILEGDRLVVYARLFNTITYEAIWGQSITIPAANADYVELL